MRYAVRLIAGEYKAVCVFDDQAEGMEERGEPMIYSEKRRAWAVARRLNRVQSEELALEGQLEDREEYMRGDES